MHNKIIPKNALLYPKVSISAIIKEGTNTHKWTRSRVTDFGTLNPKYLLSAQEAMYVGRHKVCKS